MRPSCGDGFGQFGIDTRRPRRSFRRRRRGQGPAFASNLADANIGQILAGTDASMAPGFETKEALDRSKADPDHWAKKPAKPASEAAE